MDYGPEESDSDEEMDLLNGNSTRSRSASPLTRKEKQSPSKNLFKSPATPRVVVEKRAFMLDGPGPLPSDDEDAELTEMEQSDSEKADEDDDDEDEDALDEDEDPVEEEDEDDDYKEDESEEEDDWEPPIPTSAKKTPAKSGKASLSNKTPSRSATKPRLSKLANEVGDMTIKSASPSAVSASKAPAKKTMRKSVLDDDSDEDEEPPLPAPKKKR